MKLREYGAEASAHDLLKRFRGGKLDSILQTLEQEHGITFREDFVPSYRSLVAKLFEEQLAPCEGVDDMLQELNLPKCVASSGPLEKIHTSLSITGLTKYFQGHIFSSYAIGSWKPDPGIFLHAASEMGFEPHECAVVEDSPVGIEAANSAGMFSVLYDPDDIHDSVQSTVTIQHLRELNGAASLLDSSNQDNGD